MFNFRFISTKVHGYIDYLTAAILHVLPYEAGWSRKSTLLLQGSATTAAAYSLMTNYELGAVKAIPMKGHLALDAISGASLILSAYLLDDEPASVRETLAGIGLFEIAAALMTKTQPATSQSVADSTSYVPKGVLEPRRHAPKSSPVVATTSGAVTPAG